MEQQTPEPAHPRLLEKAALVSVLFVICFTGYYGIGLTVDPARAIELRTPLDDAIPFLPWTIYLYAWVYTAMIYPVFVIRCPRLFRRVALAYLVVILVSLVCFAALPVTCRGLRGDVSLASPDTLHGWGLRFNYAWDTPYNLFPSLHLSVAAIAALSAGKARPLFGWVASVLVAGIAVAICTVKQHFVVDGVAGLLLAGAVYRVVLHPYDREAPDSARPVVYSWRGPVLYLAFHSSVYFACYVAFRAGINPWEWGHL